MPRLTDLIKQGKVPEKQNKTTPVRDDNIRIRELENLKTKREDTAEGKKGSQKSEEIEFPSESDIKKEEKRTPLELEEFEFPSESKTMEVKKADRAVTEKPLLREKTSEEKDVFPTESGIATVEEEKSEKTCGDIYDELYEFLDVVFTASQAGQKFSIDSGLELITKIIDTPQTIEHLYNKAIFKKHLKYDIKIHCINVAVFAILLGKGLGYERKKLIEVGLAALIHDIGMCKVPSELVSKEGALTDEEYALIKKHPQFGYTTVINALGEEYQWLANVVSQEQEREKGQGYPRGLKGNEIHEYAKIIGMVDVYEALSHPRPQRKRFLPYEATKVIVNSSKDMFPPKLIKVLITKLSCFPIGSYVVLNSKAIGKVVEINETSPFRPTIELLYDSAGKKLTEKKITNLQDSPLLYIVDSIFEEDLPE